jgi:hypothetical protein
MNIEIVRGIGDMTNKYAYIGDPNSLTAAQWVSSVLGLPVIDNSKTWNSNGGKVPIPDKIRYSVATAYSTTYTPEVIQFFNSNSEAYLDSWLKTFKSGPIDYWARVPNAPVPTGTPVGSQTAYNLPKTTTTAATAVPTTVSTLIQSGMTNDLVAIGNSFDKNTLLMLGLAVAAILVLKDK